MFTFFKQKDKVKPYKGKMGDVSVDLHMDHINSNLRNAHIVLNQKIVEYSKPYVPFQQGALRRMVDYPKGIAGSQIRWFAPYAHYQYYGVLYTDKLGRSFVNRYERKKVNTGIPLVQHEPGTRSHWVDELKGSHMRDIMHYVRSEFD